MKTVSTYTISEDDYVAANTLGTKPGRNALLCWAGLLVIILLAIVLGSNVVRGAATGGLIGGLSVGLLIRYVITPLLSRRHYRNYKAIHEPVSLVLQERGLEFLTADSSHLLRWDQMLKWRQDDAYILIYPMPRIYHIILKSVAESGFDIEALIAQLEAKLGPAS